MKNEITQHVLNTLYNKLSYIVKDKDLINDLIQSAIKYYLEKPERFNSQKSNIVTFLYMKGKSLYLDYYKTYGNKVIFYENIDNIS